MKLINQICWAALIVTALSVPVVFGWVDADQSAKALRAVAYILMLIGWIGALMARSLPIFMAANVAGLLILAAPYLPH